MNTYTEAVSYLDEDISLLESSITDPITEEQATDIAAQATAAQVATASRSTGVTGTTSNIEERALALLGSGIPAESVASALGVTAARISQLLSTKSFSEQVANLRYENLQKHNARDGVYDSLEDRLLGKLEKSLPLLVKPESILKAINIVNGAKRRGQSAPDQVVNQQNIVNLILPQVIASKFTVNLSNQVTKAGEQELLTMPSGNLLKQVEEALTGSPENKLLESL